MLDSKNPGVKPTIIPGLAEVPMFYETNDDQFYVIFEVK